MSIKRIDLFDKLNFKEDRIYTTKTNNEDSTINMKGYVHIKVKDKFGNIVKEIFKNNTVTRVGRNTIFQTMSKISYSVTDIYNNTQNNLMNHVVSHFCVGTGGATSSAPFTPIAPSETDTKLASPINIGTSILEPIDHKVFTSDPNGSLAIITMQFTLFLDYNQANGSGLATINEAGLVMTEEGNGSKPILLSRLTFPSIPKTQDVALEFYWYLYI